MKAFEYQDAPCVDCGKTLRRSKIPGVERIVYFHKTPICSSFKEAMPEGEEIVTTSGFLTRLPRTQILQVQKAIAEDDNKKTGFIKIVGNTMELQCRQCKRPIKVSGEDEGLEILHEKPICETFDLDEFLQYLGMVFTKFEFEIKVKPAKSE